MSGLNYEVLLCCIHMALVMPVFVLALWIIMRLDRTPRLEFTCDGTDNGRKHKYENWKTMKAVTNRRDAVTYVTQARTCEHCGYTQFRKTVV